jgi:5'-nucleotidase
LRRVFCNRTLNLRSIAAIGYDMDYTLVHYNVDEWERRAYQHIQRKLADQGWPVDGLEFDPTAVVRGLIIDTELGNLVKADRFGYVKQARHGTVPMDFDVQRTVYGRSFIDLAESRWVFLNTLFSLSEACMYGQLVDSLDQGNLPRVLGYQDVYEVIRASLDEAHVEGILKTEIIADPGRFVEPDPNVPLTLLDQRNAGKKLLLITNSEWAYTRAMMEYTFDPYLPDGLTWRDLFDLIIVAARKPGFFSSKHPFFEVINEEGLLRPVIGAPREGGTYLGGNAQAVEAFLGVSGDTILYVGDHMFADVHATKTLLRWRTALVVRELEVEIAAAEAFTDRQRHLSELMEQKEALEREQSRRRLALQRRRKRYGPQPDRSVKELEQAVAELRSRLKTLDQEIAPLAEAAGGVGNTNWGPLMRAGIDKSHMARQLERHADIYMSRVSNLMYSTPFAYFRSPRGSLPHDR